MQVWWGHCQAQEGLVRLLLACPLHGDHIGDGVAQVGHGDGSALLLDAQNLGRQPQKTCGVGLVGGVAHGDQGWLRQAQALFEHEACRGRLGAAHESPGHAGSAQVCEEVPIHQQRFAADEPLPIARIAVGVATEVEAVEHVHQGVKGRQRTQSTAAQQFERCLPVVVPAPFGFERIDGGRIRPHAAVVLHRFHDGPAVAAAHVADHAVDVKQQNSAGFQGWFNRGW